jgi:hypothetical protein
MLQWRQMKLVMSFIYTGMMLFDSFRKGRFKR